MKITWIVWLGALIAVQAFAEDTVVSANHFHLLSTKCAAEDKDSPDATPQSPPLEVDDPGTPGCNRWEINVVVDGDMTRAQKSWELPLLDLNYGIGDNLQLKYEVPYVNATSSESRASAVGESKAGIKYMFYENEESETQLAAYPQASFSQASSDAVRKGLASPGTIVTLPCLFSTKLGATSRGDVNLTANLGYNLSTKEDTANFISAGVGIGTPVLRNLVLMTELSTEQAVSALPDESRDQLLKADAGVMTMIAKQFMLFASVGHSLYASDSLNHTYALAGFRLMAGGPVSSTSKVAQE